MIGASALNIVSLSYIKNKYILMRSFQGHQQKFEYYNYVGYFTLTTEQLLRLNSTLEVIMLYRKKELKYFL